MASGRGYIRVTAGSAGGRQVYGQVLSTVLAHKQESCLQYLTVDSETYLHWRTLARSLSLTTDCDVAAFLLQHYEKTSDLQLTQCVKCDGPVVQYCVPCNIYMTHPTTASTLLQQHESSGAIITAGASCEEVVMAGDTILIDATGVSTVEEGVDSEMGTVVAVPQTMEAEGEGVESSEQQVVIVKTGGSLTDVEIVEERGVTMTDNQLEALVEACAMQGAIIAPEMTLDPHTTITTNPTTTTTTTTASAIPRSLLTPEILRKLKSRVKSTQQGTLQLEIESLVSKAAELSGLTTVKTMKETPNSASSSSSASTSSQPITVSQLSTEAVNAQTEPATEGLLHLVDCQGNTVVVGSDCLEIASPSQLLATAEAATPSGDGVSTTEALLDVSLTETADGSSGGVDGVSGCGGVGCEDLSSRLCIVLSKNDLSDDESDYYCEPLFKPEKMEDEDLKEAISVLEGRATSSSAEMAQSANSERTSVFIHDTASDTKSERSNVNKKTSEGSELDVGKSAELETEAGSKMIAERTEPSVPELHTNKLQAKKHSRKRKEPEPDSQDLNCSPTSIPQNTAAVPLVTPHSMRTRFFDKKRPSFVPLMSPTPPASPQRGQKAGRGKKLYPPTSSKENLNYEEIQGKRIRKKKVLRDEVSDFEDDDNDPDYHPDYHEAEDEEIAMDKGSSNKESKGDKNSKDKTRKAEQRKDDTIAERQVSSQEKHPTCDTRQEKQTSPAAAIEKKVDLHSQVIVITEKKDMDKLSVPVVRVQSLPLGSEIKVKMESGGLSPVKMETNIAPLEVGGSQNSRLASRISIVTGETIDDNNGSDVKPLRKKRRLHSKLVAKTYACDMCEEAMGSRAELKRHLHQHHGTRPYTCPKCPATYKNRSHLRVHLNRHADVKPFQCPHCPKNFASNYALTAHLTCHSTERPEKCEVCGLSFKSAKYLKGHLLLHGAVEKRFICQQCGARFNRKSNMLNHIKIHNDDKQYECPHCGRRFIQSGSLKSHVFRMHNPQRARPYVCEICGAARYAKDQFEKHMMIHTNTKPYKCDTCGAAFVQSNALKGHMKIHTETEGKAHWCSVCGAAFKKFASLKKHVHKIHEYPDVSLTTVEFIEIQV